MWFSYFQSTFLLIRSILDPWNVVTSGHKFAVINLSLLQKRHTPPLKALVFSRLAYIDTHQSIFSFPEKADCALCEGVKKIASRSSANLTKAAFKKRFYDTAFPVVVRKMPGYGDVEHSFEKFMAFYQDNKADLEQDACEFKINGGINDSITSLAEVLESWDHYKPGGNILGW